MTEAEMMADLAAADAAGDSTLAQHIVGKIKALRTPQASVPESALRGAAQGATLGFGDEAQGVIQALGQNVLPESLGGGTQGKPFAQLYRESRDAMRRENAAARGAHPYVYGAGQVAGSIPLAAASGGLGQGAGAAIGTGAALGGASALGESTAQGVGGMAADTALGAALGGGLTGGVIGLGKAVPYLRQAMNNVAVGAGRRALRNVGGSIAASEPLSAEAVTEALRSRAIRAGGTTEGAAARLEQLREALGGQKRAVMDALAAKGITGPAADAMAKQFAAEGTQAATTTMNPSVPRIYESAAEQVAGKGPGNLSIAQAENLKGSLQDMARASYRQLDPNEVGQAREAAARLMRKAVEDEIAQQATGAAPETQALAAQFNPIKERLSNIIAAHEVAKTGAARGANRSALSLHDVGAFLAGSTHGGPLVGTAGALASHLARTRGPSTVASLAYGTGDLLGEALNPANLRTQALIEALRNRALPVAAAGIGGETK